VEGGGVTKRIVIWASLGLAVLLGAAGCAVKTDARIERPTINIYLGAFQTITVAATSQPATQRERE
jgi:hypothetical protein